MFKSKLQLYVLATTMIVFGSLGVYFLFHSKAATQVPGDVNGDGKVNTTDFAIIASNYNKTGRTYAQGNLNNDPAGKVDVFDFAILAKNWGSMGTSAYQIPSTITSNCSKDVTTEINNWLANEVPNNSSECGLLQNRWHNINIKSYWIDH